MRLALVIGTTGTARIDGITAAGATPALSRHTPAADAEILTYGRPVHAPVTPVSPNGCPTPAVVTRAVREMIGFDVLVVDAGIGTPTAAPTVRVGTDPGADLQEPVAVPDAKAVFEEARKLGQALPADDLFVGESIPGGTTTALGVLEALGEPFGVSSSRRTNPVDRKASVVATGAAASGLNRGDLAGEPVAAIRAMGDPALAGVMGLALGRIETGSPVTLAGGTQMMTVGALLRHYDVSAPIELATTVYVAEDETANLHRAADALNLRLTVTDPAFDQADHEGLHSYVAGAAKEGAGMGGALLWARQSGTDMAAVRQQTTRCLEQVMDNGS